MPRPARARLDLGDCDSAPGLLGGRFRASTITCCMGTGHTERRCDLDHAAVAWPRGAVISSLPAHALLPIVRGDNANSGALRARDPWQSISVRCVGGSCLLLGGRRSLLASAWRTFRRCYFVKGELWLAGGRNAWVFRPTPRTRESSTRIPCCSSCPPSRCQCGDDHSTFGSPLGRYRRVMTIPAARSAAAEALAS